MATKLAFSPLRAAPRPPPARFAPSRQTPSRNTPSRNTPSRQTPIRREAGRRAQVLGIDAEAAACGALERDGWTVLARRLRTPAGEIDAVAERNGLLAIVEVKARPTLCEAAHAMTPRQQQRLLAAAETVLAEHPAWGREGVRFDMLLVDAGGAVRRIADAFCLT
jgi:putative endonuclease